MQRSAIGGERARRETAGSGSLVFFSFFDLDPRPLTSLFSLSFPPPISPTKQNKTASESGKPMKMHHDKLAKKGADEAGEGTRR